MGKIKSFFIKVGQWFKRHAPTKRRLIQIYTALLFNANIKGIFSSGMNVIYRGGVKNICSPGLNCYSCPGAVASCPLGALQNAMGNSDTRAPYYILGIIGLLGLMFARTICGFFCPVGLGQELLYKIKTPKLKKSRYTRILSYFKYVLLIVMVIAIPAIYSDVPAFCKYICPAGTSSSILQLININNDALYVRLQFLFSWKFLLLVAFIVGSVFIFRFFCRFFCPLGAIYGFFNKIALIGVKLDRQKCVDCGMCIQTCQMDIKHVGDHECINCGACISVCPTKAISWKGEKLFIKKSEIEEEVKAPSLNAVLESGTTLKTAEEVSGKQVVAESVRAETTATQSVETEAPVQMSAAVKAFNKRAFWLQFGAWALAICVLVASLVYFNFFAKGSTDSVSVGDECPDFTISTVFDSKGAYDSEGEKITEIKISECRGKVVVLNFWYTTCAPCVAEIPDFNTVRNEFSDDVMIVALHKAGLVLNADIQEHLNTCMNDGKNYWKDYSIIFGLDKGDECMKSLGVTPTYPTTVVVNKEGIVTFMHTNGLPAKDLRQAIIDAGATLLTDTIDVGDECPDFTISTVFESKGSGYGEITEIKISECRGKVVVLNFWYTTCAPCVAEIPDFNTVRNEFSDDVMIVALHKAGLVINADIQEHLDTYMNDGKNYWKDYSIIFGLDKGDECMKSLGVTPTYPTTVVVNKEGIVTFMHTNGLPAKDLRKAIIDAGATLK